MEVLIYKLRKMFSLTKIAKFISMAFVILIVFGFMSVIGIVIFEIIIVIGVLAIQWFGIPLNPSYHTINVASVLLSMITVGSILVYADSHDRRDNAIRAEKEAEDAKNKPITENNVNKIITMEVVSKKETISQQGTIIRELMFKDPIGRVIKYGNNYSHQNKNTIYFAVEEGQSYNIEWHFYDYDLTGKGNRYCKILKIDDKDVDLNHD